MWSDYRQRRWSDVAGFVRRARPPNQDVLSLPWLALTKKSDSESILHPGEVYFIREIDVLSGVPLDYVKIGLVRHDRDSSTRSKEHQTANPRDLDLICAIRTDCVGSVEKYLHWRYLRDGVRGEWFKFDTPRLEEAIRYAEELRDHFALRIEALRRGLEFGEVESSGEAIAATDEAVHWLREYQVSHLVWTDADKAQKEFNALIKKRAAEGADTSDVGRLSSSRPMRVDLDALKSSEPEIWRQYLHTRVSGKLLPERAGADAAADQRVAQAHDLVAGLRSAIAEAEAGRIDLPGVAQVAVAVRSATAFYSTEKELAGLHLQALCGQAPGIDGVCSWKRGPKEEFDLAAFKKEHPDVATHYSEVGAERIHVTRTNRGAKVEK
jgi:hypothetical protein